jgi:hypothetical protein
MAPNEPPSRGSDDVWSRNRYLASAIVQAMTINAKLAKNSEKPKI